MQDFTDVLVDLERRVDEAESYLRIGPSREEATQLESKASSPGLWDNQEEAKKITSQLATLKDDIERWERVRREVDDASALFELAREEGDESLESEITLLIESVVGRLDEIELFALFSGEHDENDAVCELHSGAGGTDACDWAEMLLRMYLRWAEGKGFDVELHEATDGGEAGISSATFLIKGRFAFGFLQAERGVHRLVRISPFDSNARRHTAFASLSVVPFFEEVSDEVVIDDKELRIDTYRSSGAGGQHVNVTDSAVRITHLPTGVVVACQNERSQHQNKDRAMQMLAAKLAHRQRIERKEEMNALAGEQREVAWGSQIRSYVLHPYQQVKDLRSNLELGNPESVLDGNLDPLMEAFLQWQRSKKADS
ncbi:MAG: peptide chain release factor 2 [Actinobacteria bacterium]|nr:peptide chain release factor 2 [Actinomycetota bacterium]